MYFREHSKQCSDDSTTIGVCVATTEVETRAKTCCLPFESTMWVALII